MSQAGLHDAFRRADVAGAGSRFIFEVADTEVRRAVPIRKIFVHKCFEAATSLALRT